MPLCLNNTFGLNNTLGLNGTLGCISPSAPDVLGWDVVLLGLWASTAADVITRILTLLLLAPYSLASVAFTVALLFRTLPEQIWEYFKPESKKFEKMQSSVWTIHGKQYDMTDYVKHHPGGEWAINLGRNRDCTGLFESYHVFSNQAKLQKILARYEIRSASTDGQAQHKAVIDVPSKTDELVFNDAFHQDVKQMLRKHFEGKSHHMKPSSGCLNIMILLGQIYSVYYFLCGRVWAMMVLPFLGALSTFMLAHDASHFAVSKRPWINSLASYSGMPLFFPATCWSLQHVVQHHVYVNDDDDVDLFHFLPACRTTRLTRWVKSFRLQYLAIWAVLPTSVSHLSFVVPVDLTTGQVDMVTGSRRYEQVQNLDDFVARSKWHILAELFLSVSFLMMGIRSFGVLDGVRRVFTVYTISSWIFVIITQGAHLQEECMVGKEDEYRSWAKRQAATSVNFATDSWFWCLVTGGLNMQSIHHVVPIVGSSHFRELYPEFKRICAKHGLPLKETTDVVQFFRGFLQWIRELAEMGEVEVEAEKEHLKAS